LNTKKKKKLGITGRWIMGSLSWIVLLVILIAVIAQYALKSYYYGTARQTMEYSLRSIADAVETSSSTGQGRYSTALDIVENFEERDKYELMLLDSSGKVIVTSSGFDYWSSDPVPEYEAAMSSEDGFSSEVFYSNTNEKCIGVTKALSEYTSSVSAVRLVSSLSKIDSRISYVELIIIGFGAIVLFFSALSGSYFIRSIVVPVRKIEGAAKQIASGDFDVRVEGNYQGEMGDLADTVNRMASGLGSTEKMKSDFISSVSHELRTPLTSIKGWGETLKNVDPSDRETYDKGIRIILSETDRLSNMVENLLDYSRMDSGRQRYDMEVLDIVAELTDAVITEEQNAAHKGLELIWNEPEETVPVWGDSARLKQVFINLLDNAIKYTNPGGKIVVQLERRPTVAVITVTDNGRGIPPDDLPKVKEKFFKASNSTKGSGIGLSIVDEIVKSHSGEFDIDSKLGSYTKAEVTLPIYREKEDNGSRED
jgi:signal transduction histidine kinase